MYQTEELLKEVVYTVEATEFEQRVLCERCLKEGNTWEWISGVLKTVGKVYAGRPVCISIRFIKINNKVIMFWEAFSMVVDHSIINKWLVDNISVVEENSPNRKTNPDNFHHVIHYLMENK